MELALFLDKLISENEAENIAVCVGKGDKILQEIYKSKNEKINEFTKFDMASVTKVLSTAMISLIAMDKGIISLKDKVCEFMDCPEDKREMTILNLLTHTMGIGHKNMLSDKNNYSNIAEYILSIPPDIPIGSNVLYSCPGYILMGKILEKVFAKPLNILFEEMVAKPLGMTHTSFLPTAGQFVNSNTEIEKLGIVNDYNCQFLGGVAGNAGVFSNMCDMKKFAVEVNNSLDKLISQKTFEAAIKNYTPGMDESRGLGFMIVDERYTQTGRLFAYGSIGHCGHTGQSIFVDLDSGFYVIILSDMTISITKKYGYDNYDKVIKLRERIHNAIFDDMKETK